MIKLTILVTGGRDFSDETLLRRLIFDAAGTGLESHEIRLVHGNARGADKLAARIGIEAGFDVVPYPANWKDHGLAAGPMRNTFMFVDSKPDVVIAVPGGTGTNDMVKKVKAAIKRGKNVSLIYHRDT